jgi:hypothetical protein
VMVGEQGGYEEGGFFDFQEERWLVEHAWLYGILAGSFDGSEEERATATAKASATAKAEAGPPPAAKDDRFMDKQKARIKASR